jgi:hypothetical protein
VVLSLVSAYPLRVPASAYTVNALVVAQHDRQPSRLIVKHEAAGVQFVVNVRRRKRLEATDDQLAEWRRDVAGRRSGGKSSRRRVIGARSRGDGTDGHHNTRGENGILSISKHVSHFLGESWLLSNSFRLTKLMPMGGPGEGPQAGRRELDMAAHRWPGKGAALTSG